MCRSRCFRTIPSEGHSGAQTNENCDTRSNESGGAEIAAASSCEAPPAAAQTPSTTTQEGSRRPDSCCKSQSGQNEAAGTGAPCELPCSL